MEHSFLYQGCDYVGKRFSLTKLFGSMNDLRKNLQIRPPTYLTLISPPISFRALATEIRILEKEV